MDLKAIVRENIWKLKPYSCARDEFDGEASIFLDANENPFNEPICRYPDPLQLELKEELSKLRGVAEKQIFVGNGSDEVIDLLFRIFCEPGVDNYIAINPTYGMYKVQADINNVEYRSVDLDHNFNLIAERVLDQVDSNSKIIFICSPNNPSGNILNRDQIKVILDSFNGVVVVDEAYIDFASEPSFCEELSNYSNLLVMQTMSKAWGLAGARVGMAYGSSDIIELFNRVKFPYNVNLLSQRAAVDMLRKRDQVEDWIKSIVEQREWMRGELLLLPMTINVYPSDSNFLLVKSLKASEIFTELLKRGIVVRDRSKVVLCDDCLRITIGTEDENQQLISVLKEII